jgi:hypothetical protein
MPPASASAHSYHPEEIAYPSRTIAFQAAGMITSIVEELDTHNEIRYTPAFIVYSLFSALIMHVYQMRSSVPSVVATCQERMGICMRALKNVSKVWLVAKMVHTLFESILGNKLLEERLQRAPGKRHQKVRPDGVNGNNNQMTAKKAEPPKRKFDDMDIGFPNGGPTPPVSYERSRPQTPAATPARELVTPQVHPGMSTSLPSSNVPKGPDGLQGGSQSRGTTRPTTPFNASFSLPATPPDLFLVTRNSPNLSPTLWENFQPDQLFPDGTEFFPTLSSPQTNMMDPQMHPQNAMPSQQPMMMNQQLPPRNMSGTQPSPPLVTAVPPEMGGIQTAPPPQSIFGMDITHTWQGLDAALAGTGIDGASQDDNWSNSSRGYGPSAPTTLNVEDW